MDILKNILKAYEKWVATNADTVTDLETTTKWISYYVAGRVSNSTIVSELIFSLSNILALYNDRIIEKRSNKSGQLSVLDYDRNLTTTNNNNNSNTTTDSNSFCYRLKVMLTTLEYCEVLIEISAKRVFGVRGKWLIVVIVQVMKAAGRLFLLKNSTEQIITTPAIPNLNRRTFLKQQQKSTNAPAEEATISNGTAMRQPSASTSAASATFTFQLKRSGRIVRKVEGAPPIEYRDFRQTALLSDCTDDSKKSSMPHALLQAEYLYIAKPLLHLASMGLFGGRKQWQQYMIALMLDMYSIRLHYKNRHLLNKAQKLELSRRCIQLLLYLMRSPFYECYTQKRLEHILLGLTNSLPLINKITAPLLAYLPHYQNTYFYLWST